MRLITTELRKLTTVPTTWVLTGIGWALAALFSLLTIFLSPTGGGFGGPEDTTATFSGSAAEVALVLDQIANTSILVLIVALLSMTTEFRHGTIGRTLQLTPSRSKVLTAKLAAGLLYALLFLAGSLVVAAAALGIGALRYGVGISLDVEVARSVWQAGIGLTLIAVLGVAVGALLRNQVLAITIALVWAFVVEGLVAGLLPEVGRWLPLQAQQAVLVSAETRAAIPELDASLLDPTVGLAVFLGYVVVAAIGAAVLLRVRDV